MGGVKLCRVGPLSLLKHFFGGASHVFNHVCADYSIDILDSLWLIDGKLIDLTF